MWIRQWTQEVSLGRRGLRKSILNQWSSRGLSNVHAVICHRYFNIGYWLQVAITRDGDTDLQVIRLHDGPKYESGRHSQEAKHYGDEPRTTSIWNTWIPRHCSREPGHVLPSWLFVTDHLHFQQETLLQGIVLVCSRNRELIFWASGSVSSFCRDRCIFILDLLSLKNWSDDFEKAQFA